MPLSPIFAALGIVGSVIVAAGAYVWVGDGGSKVAEWASGIYGGGSGAAWFIAALLVISSVVSCRMARLATRVRDTRAWSITAIFLVLTSFDYAVGTFSVPLALFKTGIILLLMLPMSDAFDDTREGRTLALPGFVLLFGCSLVRTFLHLYQELELVEVGLGYMVVTLETLQMIGAAAILTGFAIHERQLFRLAVRLLTVQESFGMPVPESSARLALRLIGEGAEEDEPVPSKKQEKISK